MHESNSENPFQSPLESNASAEGTANASRRAIWGTLAVAIAVSAGSVLIHPALGIMVLVASVAAVARTAIVTKRTGRQSEIGAKSILFTFGGSFILMGVLLVVALLATGLIGAVLTYVLERQDFGAMGEVAGTMLGFLAGGIIAGLGFWSLLPPPEVTQKYRGVSQLPDTAAKSDLE